MMWNCLKIYNIMIQHYSNKLDKHAALRFTRSEPCLDAFHNVAEYQRMSLETMARLMEKG